VDNPAVHFKQETLLALHDASFRFGLVEVGYTADWIDNPNAGKPALNLEGKEQSDSEGQVVLQGEKVLDREKLYVERVDPRTFRVSISGKNVLSQNDWCARYSWHYVDDVKANPLYKNTDDLKASGELSADVTGDERDPDKKKHAGQVRLWKIWDLRTQEMHVVADGHDKFLIEGRAWKYLPLAPLKFFEIPDEWYPLPPTFNWIGPQDEINDTREMQRRHRRRSTRKYEYSLDTIDAVELEKASSDIDNAIIAVKTPPGTPALRPVPNADLSNQVAQELGFSKDDFNQVSGVGGEQRGVPDAPTATQANIINVRSQIRESQQRVIVSEWLGDICWIMLQCIVEKTKVPMWIQMNVDPLAMDPQALARTAGEWKEITSQELGNLDVDVKIDIASLSPISQDSQRADWNQILALMMNPQMLMLMMTPDPKAPDQPSPILRKTLALNNLKSDKDVRTIWRIGNVLVKQLQAAMVASAIAKPGEPSHPMQQGAGSAAAPVLPNPGTPTAGGSVM